MAWEMMEVLDNWIDDIDLPYEADDVVNSPDLSAQSDNHNEKVSHNGMSGYYLQKHGRTGDFSSPHPITIYTTAG